MRANVQHTARNVVMCTIGFCMREILSRHETKCSNLRQAPVHASRSTMAVPLGQQVQLEN
jgi:hypothetical protein